MNFKKINQKFKFNSQVVNFLFLSLAIFVVLSLSLGFFYFKLSSQIEDIYKEQIKTASDLETTNQKIEILFNNNSDLASRLDEEKIKREDVENNLELSQVSFLSLEKNVAEQQEILEASDLVVLINDWSPRIVRLKCEINLVDGSNATAKASGIANYTSTGLTFMTNKHVIEKDNNLASVCEISFSTNQTKLEVKNISINKDLDLAYLNYQPKISLPGVADNLNICQIRPKIGDQVVILGYPNVGSEVGITATEGIISGLDEDYYITSAKIEQGNSGGAAILVKDNCLLGLPTLVVAGRIESLARILPLK